MLLTCVDVGSLPKRDRAGHTKRDNPSALERRTLPRTDKSLWSQSLKIDLLFFNLLEKFKCCLAVKSLVMNIPTYWTQVFTGMFSTAESLELCKDKVSHVDILSLRPEALEKWVISGTAFQSWFLSFKKSVVSSASWEIFNSVKTWDAFKCLMTNYIDW